MANERDIDHPRLTPQNADEAAGRPATDPTGGVKGGQHDPAEGRAAADADRLGEALQKPAHSGEEDLSFGARSGQEAPEGSPDAAVDRASAGWSGEPPRS